MTNPKILLVDDEINIIELARMYLEREGFSILSNGNGSEALDIIRKQKPDIVVLDIMLPGINGLEVCRQLRLEDNPTPIILLTARDEDIDKIIGLELGADDYLTKPFNPRELVARIKALLRRINNIEVPQKDIIKLGNLEINTPRHVVLWRGQEINLRYQEFEVLKVLAQNIGLALSREQLLNKAWGFDFSGDTRTVDMHVAMLRKKLSGIDLKIETVTGIGYKLIE